jgi:hypothetical protein
MVMGAIIFLIAELMLGMEFILISWPTLLRERFQVGDAAFSMMVIAILAFAGAVWLCYPWLTTKLSQWTIIQLKLFLVTVGLVGITWTHSFPQHMVGAACLVAAGALMAQVLPTMITLHSPEGWAATSMSIALAVAALSSTVGCSLAGRLVDWNMEASLSGVAAACGCTCLLVTVIKDQLDMPKDSKEYLPIVQK